MLCGGSRMMSAIAMNSVGLRTDVAKRTTTSPAPPASTKKKQPERLASPQNKPATATPKPPSLSRNNGTEAAAARRPRTSNASLAMVLCNAMDGVINSFVDPPALRSNVDPRHVLLDNFAPVDELPPTPCPVVEGAIPACLAGGAYVRNGPNPQHLPRGTHHLFDGDGMLHSLLLPAGADGKQPIFCSRYVQTYKYLLERNAGAPVIPNVFSGFHGVAGLARGAVTAARILTGQMNPLFGAGTANTSLAFFGRRLFALGESDLPYELRLDPRTGDILTVGRTDFDGSLFMSMTAHPKKDPATGEVFAFRYTPFPPFVSYFRFDAAGKRSPDVPIFSVRDPSFMHDFAITENYAVFADIQITMKPADMIAGNGAPVGFERSKVPRLGILPKYAADESKIRWFDVPGFNIFHTLNAWEEDGGDEIVLVAPNVLSVEHALDNTDLVHSAVEMVRVNLRSGLVTRTPLSSMLLEFGVIHPGYVGRRNRYAYLGIGCPMPNVSGIAKVDFSLAGKGECVVARRDFGEGSFAGEPFFVPDEAGASEDEGYVVCFVHNHGGSGESRFVVMDARSPDLDIVAAVALPRRVPGGFHGLFVSRQELLSQRPYN